jgi:hypothetical protein
VKKLIVLGGIIGVGYLLLNLRPVDFMSTACRAEAAALQQRSERLTHDLLAIGDTYTVTGRSRPGAVDEVEQREERYLADLDAFDHRCN